MLKQITLERAFELINEGVPVPILVPGSVVPYAGGDWTDLQAMYLDDLLSGVICFEGKPVGKMESEPEPKPAKEPKEPKPKKTAAKKIDWGKVWALRDAGRNWEFVSQEVGASIASLMAKKDNVEAQDAFAAYRAMKGGDATA